MKRGIVILYISVLVISLVSAGFFSDFTAKITGKQIAEDICSEARVFVTSNKYDGNLGGLEGADEKCQLSANNAGLDGRYKAWLSTFYDSASERLYHSEGKYFLLNGEIIADNWEDLTDNELYYPINIDEYGNTIGYGVAWTGTTATGDQFCLFNSGDRCCDSWLSNEYGEEASSYQGDINAVNSLWSLKPIRGYCSGERRLYCIEQPEEGQCEPQEPLACEGNFDCDFDVDGTDARTFKENFGRSSMHPQRPCSNSDPCWGDFDCDFDVDGTDAVVFKEDFGRSLFSNYCPPCSYSIPGQNTQPCEYDDCEYNFPKVIIRDFVGDQPIPQNDILSTELKQISNDYLQIKITLNGNPLSINGNPHYSIFIDSDNNKETGRYWDNWDIGEDVEIFLNYDEIRERWYSRYLTQNEGFIAENPLLIKDNSIYVIFPLKPYTNSYSFNNIIKFGMYSAGDNSAGDYVESVGELELQNNINLPNYKIISGNEIFPSSPHSMYLDYEQRDNPIRLVIMEYDKEAYFFSTNSEIAEIIDGDSVRTNFDIFNRKDNSDFSLITAYLEDCDIMLTDYIIALSGTYLFKGEKSAFLIPEYGYDENNGNILLYENYLDEYFVEDVTDHAIDIQTQFTGRVPDDGENRIFSFNYPACGWAGQPIWLGWGCVLVYYEESYMPQWEVYYHELGHTMNTHIFSNKFPGLRSFPGITENMYSEAFATLNQMYTNRKLIENFDSYGIPLSVKDTIQEVVDHHQDYFDSRDCEYDSGNSFCNNNEECDHELDENWRYCDDCGCFTSVWAYENLPEFNREYEKIDPNILDGMFYDLAENQPYLNPYGWEVYPRFYKILHPDYWYLYDTVEDGETFFVAALSSAAEHDLRSLFRGRWNIPVDNNYYDELIPIFDVILSNPEQEESSTPSEEESSYIISSDPSEEPNPKIDYEINEGTNTNNIPKTPEKNSEFIQTPSSLCNTCGDGFWRFCTENVCNNLGTCFYSPRYIFGVHIGGTCY